MEQRIRLELRFFIYRLKINTLVGESLSFVSVFLLESLEGILMAKLSLRVGGEGSLQP